jgi:hypothetical protein
MELFQLVTAQTIPDAVKAQAQSATAQNGADVRFIAGGTNLVDYMKLNVERPRQLVDINGLPIDKIERTSEGGLKIGALARNADVAQDAMVKEQYAVLSQALLSGASPQLRNMATPLAIFSRRRVVCTTETPRRPATNESRVRVVPPSAATTVCWQFLARVTTALLQIPPTRTLR